MSNSSAVGKVKNPILEQFVIIVLLVAVLFLALLSAYKFFVREPAISPEEMDLKTLTASVKANPEDKELQLLLAFNYQKAGNFKQANEHYNEVLKMDSKDLGALYNLGMIAKTQEKYGEAEKRFKEVLGIKKTHFLATLGLAEVYIAKAEYDNAIKVLNSSIKEQGHLVNLRLLKAQALEKKGNKAEAVKEYREILKYVPDKKEALNALERLQ